MRVQLSACPYMAVEAHVPSRFSDGWYALLVLGAHRVIIKPILDNIFTCTLILLMNTYMYMYTNNHVHSALQLEKEREQSRKKERPHSINKIKFTAASMARKA